MRWKEKKYKSGDKKRVKYFAWLPKKIGDYNIWLEFYYTDYEYGYVRNGGYYRWFKIRDELID